MLSAGLNETDFKRITDKLNKLKLVLTEPNNPANPLAQYKFSVLFIYQNAIIRAMGSVLAIDYGEEDADGNFVPNPNKSFGSGFSSNVVIDLKGLGIRQTHWKNLAPMTIETKRRQHMRMTIWEASGDTKKAVRVHRDRDFAGIVGSDPNFQKALHAELGYSAIKQPSRALFTIANDIVMSQKAEIEKRIKNIILTYVSWGS